MQKSQLIIIGISGKMGSGKDTAAEVLVEHGYVHEAFADNVKRVTAMLTGIPTEDIFSRDIKGRVIPGIEKTVGKLFQLVGNGLRDVVHPDVWVHSLLGKYEVKKDAKVVISDVRYPNEIKAIQEKGGVVIRLERSREERMATIEGDGRDLDHVSETSLDDYGEFDYVIKNIGTLKQFRRRIEFVLEDMIE